MPAFPFAGVPDADKSNIMQIAQAERERQWRRLIMIPSESICHPAAAEILSGELGNIYAEGLPQPMLCHDPREVAPDEALFQAWQNRLADRRYYKGTVQANRAELIAHRAIARVFSLLPGSPAASEIFVNVQPLSGAVANQAVYEALLKPGERIMGLDLSHGGHLTHGSIFNFSGKRYEAHSYGIQQDTRKLDYEKIRERALESRPRIIIGGASAYPWDFDWPRLRKIADEIGAYLLADIAHLAGMVVGGVLNNPLRHAHVVTFTTHKTLCGPRGAAILSTNPDIAKKLDNAVFPGLQGGPHMNSIAAIGRLFELIHEDITGFGAFQRRIVENTAYFAERLVKEGFSLEYGGTNTHMLLVDLKKLPMNGDTFLDGEIASRLLELAGIVCNKNVIPGDVDAAHASGLRFGLPWLTQRGITKDQLAGIALAAMEILRQVRTTTIWSPSGEQKCRGRLPQGIIRSAAKKTLAVAEALPYPPRPVRKDASPKISAASPINGRAALLLRGEKVRLALSELLTARLPFDQKPVRARMLDADAKEIADVVALELSPEGRLERWALFIPHEQAQKAREWLEELSDGYLMFDSRDLSQKIDGPMVVEELDPLLLPKEAIPQLISAASGKPAAESRKAYFVGQRPLYAASKSSSKEKYVYVPPDLPLRKTVLNETHRALGAKMAPFAGWEMPIQYPSGILAEHRAVRAAAGLYDVSHMSALEVSGPGSLMFLERVLANRVSWLDPGEAQYTCALYPDGVAMDDLFVYRFGKNRFMVVMNASNAERVMDWTRAANDGSVIIDAEMPGKEVDGPVALRNLRSAGEDSLIGIAFQGPVSLSVLQKMAATDAERDQLGRICPNMTTAAHLSGIRSIIARTGYTGEKMGFEIYAHPDRMKSLWNGILEIGRPLGVLPAGLGARDSARVEAGLPLFGHELEGDLRISVTEAGYGFVVRFHAPFFVGRNSYKRRSDTSRRHILRLRGQGRKTLRAGHVILDSAGKPAGQVTSFAYVHPDMTFFCLACVREDFLPLPGSKVIGARVNFNDWSGEADERSLVELTALTRFPDDAEKTSWAERYV